MKFFPYESNRSIRDELHDYFEYVGSLNGAIPGHLLELMDLSLGLDDGLLVRVRHDRDRRELELTLRCGHSQMGYYDLVLCYHHAEVTPEHDLALARVARTTKSHLRYESDLAWHEFDVTGDGLIVHRLLFHRRGDRRGIWFAVTARSIDWKRVPRPRGQAFAPSKDRYPGGPIL